MDKKRINLMAYELWQSTDKIQCEQSVMINLIEQLYNELDKPKLKLSPNQTGDIILSHKVYCKLMNFVIVDTKKKIYTELRTDLKNTMLFNVDKYILVGIKK